MNGTNKRTSSAVIFRIGRWTVFAAIAAMSIAGCATNPGSATKQSGTPRIVNQSFNGLACVSSSRCLAVGTYLPVDQDSSRGDPDGDGQATHTLIDSFNGNTWSRSRSPDKGKGGSTLDSIACPAVNDCIAVGFYKSPQQQKNPQQSFPLIETYNGHRWSIVDNPVRAPNSVLVGVSCPNTDSCVAVGYTTSRTRSGAFNESLLVETYSGTSWAAGHAPTPVGSSSGFNAVSCLSASSCVAVGATAPINNDSSPRPLIEQLDNGIWSPALLPLGSRGPGILYAVTCSVGSQCIAVGNTQTAQSTSSALVLSLIGSTWQTNGAALSQQGFNSLTTISCSSASFCIMGGTSANSVVGRPGVLVAELAEGAWDVVQVSGASGFIRSAACPRSSGCFFAGSAGTASLLASLNGNAWKAQHSPIP